MTTTYDPFHPKYFDEDDLRGELGRQIALVFPDQVAGGRVQSASQVPFPFGNVLEHRHGIGASRPEADDLAFLDRHAELARVPFSFTVHGPEEFDRPQAIALPEKIRRASRVVAISSFGRSQLFRWAGAEDWRKVAVVHCGVDESYLAAGASSPAANVLVSPLIAMLAIRPSFRRFS